jgi:hypothetical protein
LPFGNLRARIIYPSKEKSYFLACEGTTPKKSAEKSQAAVNIAPTVRPATEFKERNQKDFQPGWGVDACVEYAAARGLPRSGFYTVAMKMYL